MTNVYYDAILDLINIYIHYALLGTWQKMKVKDMKIYLATGWIIIVSNYNTWAVIINKIIT